MKLLALLGFISLVLYMGWDLWLIPGAIMLAIVFD